MSERSTGPPAQTPREGGFVMDEWVTVEDLADAKGIIGSTPEGQAWASKSVRAVNAFLARRRPDIPHHGFTTKDAEYADVRLGACLLAQALYERRGAASESDIWTYPARLLDANVAELLGLNRVMFS